MDTNNLSIDLTEAHRILDSFIPMFQHLNENNVDYCVVGGLAVLIHAVLNENTSLRMTEDADIMVSYDYSNRMFAEDYLSVYASDPLTSDAIYSALFYESGLDSLNEDDEAFANISFVGADAVLDGVDTPNFDVVRRLNAKCLESISAIDVSINGVRVPVATAEDLIEMKQDTIALLRTPIYQSSRPQDYVDIEILEEVINNPSPMYTTELYYESPNSSDFDIGL